MQVPDLLSYSPGFNLEDASSLAQSLYGLGAFAAPLPSERDQNFLLTTGAEAKFVLKIANSREEHSFIKAQNLVLTHLGHSLAFCPRVLPSLSGAQIETVTSTSGSTHLVRLVTYLPGVPLAEVKHHSLSLPNNFGKALGQLDRTLGNFDHPALHRSFHWDLKNGLDTLRDYGPLVKDRILRKSIEKVAQAFENEKLSSLPKLPRSIIHGDANDFNILVGDNERVTGIIDFGDMLYGYTVGELAIALAYIVLGKQSDPFPFASAVVGSYCREYLLNETELQILWPLMLMRLCMSVCMAAYQQRQRPENVYLDISQTSISASLSALAAIDWDFATAELCKKLVPC